MERTRPLKGKGKKKRLSYDSLNKLMRGMSVLARGSGEVAGAAFRPLAFLAFGDVSDLSVLENRLHLDFAPA
jgi:hypothetical protein